MMVKNQDTKLKVVVEDSPSRKAKSASNSERNSPRLDDISQRLPSCPGTPLKNGVSKAEARSPVPNTLPHDIDELSLEMNKNKSNQKTSNGLETKVELSPSRTKVTSITIADDKDKPDLGRLRNYQIKFIKKGVPNIDPKDNTVQRILMKKRDLKISPLWVCQRRKDETPRNATAWAFSTLVTFICLIFPLLSFSSDVAFYVTCSDHYNHTAGVLEEVRSSEKSDTKVEETQPPTIIEVVGYDRQNDEIRRQSVATPDSSNAWVPPPLQVRDRRSLYDIGSKPEWRNPIQVKTNRNSPVNLQLNEQLTMMFPRFLLTSSPRESARSKSVYGLQANGIHPRPIVLGKDSASPRETNFEFETEEHNETSCAAIPDILRYMRSDKAVGQLEAHRHVTIDIFEPVFILGSFPSLILCILTRLVVLLTWHKNFLSAYVINMACMPLQLITGALGVHSASYHLGKMGFECWHCAVEGNCSGMAPLWWLHDGVTKTLLVSILTKILDGMAGGVVLFVVIIRILWPEGGHATFWWNTIRGFAIFAAFVACISISPLLVITPAMSVLRLQFMELATPFPGRERISFTLTVLMCLGLAAWCLSFAVLLVYVIYSMYMYCRARTIDK